MFEARLKYYKNFVTDFSRKIMVGKSLELMVSTQAIINSELYVGNCCTK